MFRARCFWVLLSSLPSRCPHLVPLSLSLPPSPLAGADLPFPSPSRCPPLVPLSLSLPASRSPLPVCRPWLPATSIAVAHPPTLASLLFPTHFFSQVSTAWGIGLIVGPAVGGFLAQLKQSFAISEFVCN